MEDATYDSQAIRRLIGIDLNREEAPDATTLLKLRRLLETHHLTKTIFNTINLHLSQKGLLMRKGSIVYATLIAVPRPRMIQVNAIRKCIRLRRATNGISG